MAYVLSLMPHSPLAAPYQERKYERSWSSLGSNATVQRHRNRQHSVGSFASSASMCATSRPSANNHTPIRSTSYSDLAAGRPLSRQRTLSANSCCSALHPVVHPENLDILGSSADSPKLQSKREVLTPGRREPSALGLVDEEDGDEAGHVEPEEVLPWHTTPEEVILRSENDELNHDIDVKKASSFDLPFSRWLSTLRRRKTKQHTNLRDGLGPLTVPSPPVSPEYSRSVQYHRKSESWTSTIDFVTAVKSASVTVASFSIGNLSRSGTRRSGRSRLWHESGGSDARRSIDSGFVSLGPVLDEAAHQRSKKRREKLEELIRTEESYLADLKALSNAYFTLLPPLLPHTSHTRTSARSNIADMIQLHDEILGELHRVIPQSDHDSAAAAEASSTKRITHARWRSEDGTSPLRPRQAFSHAGWSKRRSFDITTTLQQDLTVLPCSPGTVSEVARVFARDIRRFALYEEYGARCEMMQDDVDFFQKATLYGSDYDKAIEALCASLNPLNTREANRKKALSLKDLLIKPIQRITRYELLFRDLCRYTPSCDDPDSHTILNDVLGQLTEICQSVNKAKDNPERLRVLENSWLLQGRLFFQDKVCRSSLSQSLGRLHLCGVLYVAYRTRNQIQGRYMICVMYESCLILAVAESTKRYNVMITTSLATASIEETDNEKGLQCHTAPHTWKIVFESAGKMFEVILAACSEAEEGVWRKQLSVRIAAERNHFAEGHVLPRELSSPLANDLRSVGKAYGKAGDFARRLSIHRTATMGPLSDLNQVIIKHTEAPKDEPTNSSSSSLPIRRSQSDSTPSHVPTLAPMRRERIKMETILSDVWTKDAIPYPGMGTRRSEYSLRDTANDLIRKLSMASIASNFSKRSMSYTGVSSLSQAGNRPPKAKKLHPEVNKPKRPPLIDFHNAPDAFLPEDFELQDPRSKRSGRGGLGFRTLTMTGCDRPRSPFFFSQQENRPPETDRPKSVLRQSDADSSSLQDVPTDETAKGVALVSRQQGCDGTMKAAPREAGKKARLLKLLGKVRPSDDG